MTRIAVQPLSVDQGLVREAMNSLYSLFGTTREVLKAAGPDVGASRDSVGGIALAQPAAGIAVLNVGSKADGKYYGKTWEKLGDRVGWRVERSWINYSKVTFDTSSLRGHLLLASRVFGRSSLASRLIKCNI